MLKDVQWCGDSLEVIRQWPIGVRATIGEDLRRLQKGEKPRDWKPFPGLIANAFELRDQDKSGACLLPTKFVTDSSKCRVTIVQVTCRDADGS